VRLEHEGVRAAHALLEPHVDLAGGEVVGGGGHQLGAQLLGDGARQRRVRPPGYEDESRLAAGGDASQRSVLLPVSVGACPCGGTAPPWFPRASSARAWGESSCSPSPSSALLAASAEGVPGRRRSTQPSMLRCVVVLIASAPGGTSLRSTVPAPV